MTSEAAPAAGLKTPWHLWVVGVLSLFWNGYGAWDFTATVTHFEPYLSQFPKAMLDYTYSLPTWMFVIWAVGTLGGLIGTILLLLRMKLATLLFALSAAGAITSGVVSYLNPPPGGADPVFPTIIVVIALGLASYSYWLQRRSVLR